MQGSKEKGDFVRLRGKVLGKVHIGKETARQSREDTALGCNPMESGGRPFAASQVPRDPFAYLRLLWGRGMN